MTNVTLSRAPRGARELKRRGGGRWRRSGCRAPRGARELKLAHRVHRDRRQGRAPRGARELKHVVDAVHLTPLRRAPCRCGANC